MKSCEHCQKEILRLPSERGLKQFAGRKYCSSICSQKGHKMRTENYRKEYYLRKATKRSCTISGRYSHLKASAKQRGLYVSLSKEQYTTLLSQLCYYCEGNLSPSGVGLDRLDNTQGYLIGNVVPCCGVCNVWRADKFTPEEIKVAMRAIKDFRNSKQEVI